MGPHKHNLFHVYHTYVNAQQLTVIQHHTGVDPLVHHGGGVWAGGATRAIARLLVLRNDRKTKNSVYVLHY